MQMYVSFATGFTILDSKRNPTDRGNEGRSGAGGTCMEKASKTRFPKMRTEKSICFLQKLWDENSSLETGW